MTQAPAGQSALDPVVGVAGGLQAFAAIVLVLAVVATLAWLVRRGTLRLPGSLKRQTMTIESATPLGERRSLVVVSVEGRRLLLGLTPTQVSLVTELASPPPPSFDAALRDRLPRPEPAS